MSREEYIDAIHDAVLSLMCKLKHGEQVKVRKALLQECDSEE